MSGTRKSPRLTRLYKSIGKLADGDKLHLFYALKDDLFPDPRPDIRGRVKDIREARNAEGLSCPHCHHLKVIRFGTYRTRQRYRCQNPDCHKTFNDTTLTPLAGTHYPDLWLKFLQYMVSGKPLREIAKRLGIHLSTAFYWRHKVLHAIREPGFDGLEGIVESDETYFLESFKGKRDITFRKPRKRGGAAKQRGLSREQVCVFVAQDRKGHVLSQVAGNGPISAKQVGQILGPYVPVMKALCSDAAAPYRTFARLTGIEHQQVNAQRGERVKKGLYHIQHVNAHHQRLKKWIGRFNGVATRWTDNYLAWFRFVDGHSQVERGETIQEMLVKACLEPSRSIVAMLRPA